MTQENLNNLENNEIPKATHEKVEEKEISPEEFLSVANNEEQKFKQETTDEINKLNSVDTDQPSFEKIKNETGIEKELSALNTESEIVINEAMEQVKNPQQKTMAEMRAPNITRILEETFQDGTEFSEANRIALKINDLIEKLPEEEQQKASEKMRRVLNNKDIYFYKELHDEILESSKKLKNSTEQTKNIAEPDPNNAINYTTYIDKNGESRNIQSQYFDDPNKIRVNLGRGWEIISKDEYKNILNRDNKQSDIKIENSNETNQAFSVQENLYTKSLISQPEKLVEFWQKTPTERRKLIEDYFDGIYKRTQPEQGIHSTGEVDQVIEKPVEEIADSEYLETLLLNRKLSELSPENQVKYKEQVGKYSEGLKSGMRETNEKGETLAEIAKDIIRDKYDLAMNKIGIPSSSEGLSDRWIYWDLGKQSYLYEHPEESNENYSLGDPFLISTDNKEIFEDIVNRHIGWEVLGYVKNNPSFTNTLDKSKKSYTQIISLLEEGQSRSKFHSYQLSELGKLVQENRGI